jgi:glycosyltransferase involved in cell wall biosynthesis
MKLAFVVHRFGSDIAGGSEMHCRIVAERLSASHDVTVLTTCAKDHISWANAYPAGVARHGRVEVRRFPVARTRSLHRFAEASEIAFDGRASPQDQENWFRENGPFTPALLDHLRAHGGAFDLVLFWSFRYYQTFFGLPLVADRAVLVPTAEEDPVIRFDILEPFFALPAGFLFLTPEEHALVARRAGAPLAPSAVVGSGLETPIPLQPASPSADTIAPPFVLYLGRIDPNKGCETLVRHFLRYRQESGSTVPLVMAGPANMPLPDDPAIKVLGFVDERLREALLSNASVLVVPSPYESLSLVLLEAWNHAVPGLVNGRCGVLKGQALRSNGALYFRSYDEFAHALRLLLDSAELRRTLGGQGRDYVDREYRWPVVIEKIDRFLTTLQDPEILKS